MTEQAALKKKLVIEIDVVTGNIDCINDDELTYAEILGTLEYAKFMFMKEWADPE